MTSARQLRRMIEDDPRYCHLAKRSMESAIAEIRRLRKVDAQYHSTNNRQFEYRDRFGAMQ